MSSDNTLEPMTLPAGFVIKCEGVPFVLAADTVVLGHRGNMVWLRLQEERTSRPPVPPGPPGEGEIE